MKNQILNKKKVTYVVLTIVGVVGFVVGDIAVKLSTVAALLILISFLIFRIKQNNTKFQEEVKQNEAKFQEEVKQNEAKAHKEVLDRIDDRIWDIPIEMRCRHCSSIEMVDFGLETQGFVCEKCNGYNKLFIHFTAIGETENSRSDG